MFNLKINYFINNNIMSMKQVNLMHMIIIGPLLSYIGYNNSNTEDKYFHALTGITSMIPFIVRLPKGDNYHSLINLSHYLIYIPFFFYVSFKGQKLNKNIFKLLFVLGIIVIIIHSYLLYKKVFLCNKNIDKN